MENLVTGLHHISAIATDPQKNVDFYTKVLGLRFVKKTINFDASDVYHLYYGNELGSPGTIMTFFSFPSIQKGRKGKGQLTSITFSISEEALDFWMKRLKSLEITFKGPFKRFDDSVITFEDQDGLGLELSANKNDSRIGFVTQDITVKNAIKGFYGITLMEECYEKTANLLTSQMDHVLVGEESNRYRFAASNKKGEYVDILCSPDTLLGVPGYGTVHHVAFATPNITTQEQARTSLIKYGLNATPIIDREYFHSIYFREPGGVLFEIATISPGFTVDEPLEHLGESLKLPPWEEPNRSRIEKILPLIHL